MLDTLNILSQLARISKLFYEQIHNLNIYKDIKILLQHPEPCNLFFLQYK